MQSTDMVARAIAVNGARPTASDHLPVAADVALP